jgi:hypothetical protein
VSLARTSTGRAPSHTRLLPGKDPPQSRALMSGLLRRSCSSAERQVTMRLKLFQLDGLTILALCGKRKEMLHQLMPRVTAVSCDLGDPQLWVFSSLQKSATEAKGLTSSGSDRIQGLQVLGRRRWRMWWRGTAATGRWRSTRATSARRRRCRRASATRCRCSRFWAPADPTASSLTRSTVPQV